jgi:hypothetical protein
MCNITKCEICPLAESENPLAESPASGFPLGTGHSNECGALPLKFRSFASDTHEVQGCWCANIRT